MADSKNDNGYEPYHYYDDPNTTNKERSGYRVICPYDVEVMKMGIYPPITDNKLEKYDGGDYYYPRINYIQSLIDLL
jgi:hypothetical protein